MLALLRVKQERQQTSSSWVGGQESRVLLRAASGSSGAGQECCPSQEQEAPWFRPAAGFVVVVPSISQPAPPWLYRVVVVRYG